MTLELLERNSLEATEQENWVAPFLLGYGESTRNSYSSDLKFFFGFCEAHGVAPRFATRAVCSAFCRDQIENRGLSTTTAARRLTTLSSYFSYGVSEGYIERNPVQGIRRPRARQQTASTGLTKPELGALLGAAKEDSYQSFALVALLGMNGLRISEALSLDIEDIERERGFHTIKVLRKGGQEVVVPMNPLTFAALAGCVEYRTSGPVFLAPHGGRLDRFRAWRLIRKLAAIAVPEKADSLHPHDLRHTFITLSLDAGAPLQEVQDAANHADPRTTQMYNRARNRLDRNPTFLLGKDIV